MRPSQQCSERNLPLAIDARRQKYPEEESYEYAPFRGVEVK